MYYAVLCQLFLQMLYILCDDPPTVILLYTCIYIIICCVLIISLSTFYRIIISLVLPFYFPLVCPIIFFMCAKSDVVLC